MKIKLFFLLSLLFFINISAQDYIFGKVTSEENIEMPDVTVINIRTDERAATNQDGHFMISGRQGDELRFIKLGYERSTKRVADIGSPMSITLIRSAALIAEVEIKKGITGDLKIDSKNLDRPKKVEKLVKDIDKYILQKSDPRVLAAKGGEFVQPKGQGFSIGKVKNKWDDIDLMNYIQSSLGEKYFTDLKISKPEIQTFIFYVFAGGFERKKILKYGFCSDGDLYRFQHAVLTRISSYRSASTQK
ncbi:carboxypeptidase-like regulatory domain-containing protein [Chryseobacterium sp. H1D6B]|uniref:carboxypeptidase-like regulatory domain-containing protein n=1 Tax=Chryseobacterium sp. H1D6B TaxID=2940588 RepID=UPI0015CBEEE0|nr:carboxypeptidase-like regulatory domain-containing protein [Chryseobacterium sp. H1D6B]